jgi:hypothetical protein
VYHPARIAAAELRLAARWQAYFPSGFTRHPAEESIARAESLAEVWDPLTLTERRPLTPPELQFVRNERNLCSVDYRYFGERYIRINKEGQELAPLFPLWESQALILGEMARIEQSRYEEGHPDGILIDVLKGRQLGCSTLAQSCVAHRVITQPYVKALIASDTPDNSGSDGLFGMAELLISNLPWWLKPKETFHTKNRHIHFETGSLLRTEAGKSMKGGLTEKGGSKGQMGRSKTYSVLHLSELSTWEHAEQIDDSLMPAVPRTPRTLAFLESTAKGRANWWHLEWQAAVRGRSRRQAVFIPWYAERTKYWLPPPPLWAPSGDTLAFARRAELEGPKYMRRAVTLSREQLYWYEVSKLEFTEKGVLYKFLEEYPATPEEAFQYSGRSIFPLAVQERIKEQARPMLCALEVAPKRELQQALGTRV